MILLATLTTLVPYAFSAAAQLMLTVHRARELHRARGWSRDAAIATLAFAYSVLDDRRRRPGVVAKGFLLLMAGIPVYVCMQVAARQERRRGRSGIPPGVPETAEPRQTLETVRYDAHDNHLHPTHTTPGERNRSPGRGRSEVGALRRVILHRPGHELKRLTPTNKDDLLFDDVLWVKRARQEHDAFADALVERGVEVLYLDELLTETLSAEARRDRAERRHVRVGGSRAAPHGRVAGVAGELSPDDAGRGRDRRA